MPVETVLAGLEEARAILEPAEDAARWILSSDEAQPRPLAVAQAWEKIDVAVTGMLALVAGTPAGDDPVTYLLDQALLAVIDASDDAQLLIDNPTAGEGPRKVAAAVLDVEGPLLGVEALVGKPDDEEPDPEPPEEPGEPGEPGPLPPIHADPDLEGMEVIRVRTPAELGAALDRLDGTRECMEACVEADGDLELTGTYRVTQGGYVDDEGRLWPLVLTAPPDTIGERDPDRKPHLRHLEVGGRGVWLHGWAAEYPHDKTQDGVKYQGDHAPAVLVKAGAADVLVTRCWLDCPAGVRVEAASRVHVFANDLYGAPGPEAGDQSAGQVSILVTKTGPLPDRVMVGANYLGQLRDLYSPSCPGMAFYTYPGVLDPDGDKSKPYDRNLRTSWFFDNLVSGMRKYLVYNKHACNVWANRVRSVRHWDDSTGTGKAYHVLASRGGNWQGGSFQYNVCEAAAGARCDLQGWEGSAAFNDWGGCDVNVWAGLDQADGKSLLAASHWELWGNLGGKYKIGTTRNGAYHPEWPILDVTWSGEGDGTSWHWCGGEGYQPSNGAAVPWGGDGRSTQALKYEGVVVVPAGELVREPALGQDPEMDRAPVHGLEKGNRGLAYQGGVRWTGTERAGSATVGANLEPRGDEAPDPPEPPDPDVP